MSERRPARPRLKARWQAGFKAGATVFVTNRLCVLAGTGEVRNSGGEAVTFVSIDGIEFRPR